MKTLRLALWPTLLLLAACQVPVRPEPVQAPPEPAPPAPSAAKPRPAPVEAPAVPEPEVAPDPIDTGAELFASITARLSQPACINGEANRRWRKRYAGHPATFARQIEQTLPLMAYVAAEVERRGLPGEMVFVPIVESWYRPEALGPGGPAGMWQMIASTARNHGISVVPGYDGRLSPVASTDAALDYLEALSERFDGDWRAMAMAYNAGEYRIERAFKAAAHRRASGERRQPAGLPHVTYEYIAKLRALSCLVSKPEAANLQLPLEARFVPLVRVDLPPGASTLDQAAIALRTEASTLRRLNPAYRQGRIVAGVPREVLVPGTPATLLAAGRFDGASAGADAIDTTGGEAAAAEPGGRRHVVRRGDTLSAIARRYDVPLRELFRLNGLDGRSVLRPGQELRVDP